MVEHIPLQNNIWRRLDVIGERKKQIKRSTIPHPVVFTHSASVLIER